jgi:hypothetical protein
MPVSVNADNLIFVGVYYGAPSTYVAEAFNNALSAANISEEDAVHLYGLNAPFIPDENGMVPPPGCSVRIYANGDKPQLITAFMQAMTPYENPLPLRPATKALDCLLAAWP